MMRRLSTYHELFLDVPDAGMWGNPVTLGFTLEELAPPVPLEQFDSVLHSLVFQVQQTPAPEGKNGVKNKELFLRFLNGFSQYARLGRVRFRTEGGSPWAITVEEAREKFRDFWTPALEKLIQSWLRMEALHKIGRASCRERVLRLV